MKDIECIEEFGVPEQDKEKVLREYLIRVFKLYLHYLLRDIRRKWNSLQPKK